MNKMSLYLATRHINGLKLRVLNHLIFCTAIKHMGKGSMIAYPSRLDHPEGIRILDKSSIAEYSWLHCCEENSEIIIGSQTQIGHYFHCVSLKKVNIGSNVLIADRVFLTDCTHDYRDVTQPIINNGIHVINKVSIGEGAWLGEGVCILGASVGKHSVVGSNSVVTHDVPDYCIAAGIPAKIIGRFSFDESKWKKSHER